MCSTSSSWTFMFSSWLIHACSPSICQYSARCRSVRDFSARKDGVIEYTRSRLKHIASRYIWADWLRYATWSKYLKLKSVEPPSQAFVVIMGGVTSKNLFLENHSRAADSATDFIFNIVFCCWERSHKWRLSSKNSTDWSSCTG